MSSSAKFLGSVTAVVMIAIIQTAAGDDLERVEEHSVLNRCGDRCDGNSPNDMGSLLQLPPFTGLVQRRRYKTPSGKIKVKYQQVLSGLPIVGSVLSVDLNSSGGFTGRMHGELVRTITSATMKANVSPLDALRALAGKFYARKTNQLQISDIEFYEQQLVWYPLKNEKKLRFSYHCRFQLTNLAATTAGPLTNDPLIMRGYVDAITGQPFVYWNDLGFQQQPQPFPLAGVGGNVGAAGRVYYNNISVVRLADGVTCQYATDRVQVQNLGGSVSGKFTAAKALCADANSTTFDYVNGGYSALNDAAKYGDVVISMYQAYVGVSSPLTYPPLKIRVHFGTDYPNAFWDGNSVTIGDGGSTFYPLSSLDIIAHEVTHGFTQGHSDLQPLGEPGGINEAFSDAAAQAARFFYSNSTDFTIGKLVNKSGTPIRDMCQPTSDGKSIDNYSQYPKTGGMDPHYSCGLYNKAFCQLAKTTGWSVPDAFAVFAIANGYYWGQLTTFANGVCGVRQAAIDVGNNPLHVDAAFAAVGLSCPAVATG